MSDSQGPNGDPELPHGGAGGPVLDVRGHHLVPQGQVHLVSPTASKGLAHIADRNSIPLMPIAQSELDRFLELAKGGAESKSRFLFGLGILISAVLAMATSPPVTTFTVWALVVPVVFTTGLYITISEWFRWRKDEKDMAQKIAALREEVGSRAR